MNANFLLLLLWQIAVNCSYGGVMCIGTGIANVVMLTTNKSFKDSLVSMCMPELMLEAFMEGMMKNWPLALVTTIFPTSYSLALAVCLVDLFIVVIIAIATEYSEFHQYSRHSLEFSLASILLLFASAFCYARAFDRMEKDGSTMPPINELFILQLLFMAIQNLFRGLLICFFLAVSHLCMIISQESHFGNLEPRQLSSPFRKLLICVCIYSLVVPIDWDVLLVLLVSILIVPASLFGITDRKLVEHSLITRVHVMACLGIIFPHIADLVGK